MLRLLPWEYGVRNLFRRPVRSALTLAALTLVVLLVLVAAGFVRGLEASLDVSGRPGEALAVGKMVTFEGREWGVSGRFAAVGSALEAELWCPLDDLQQATRRQDYSLVALALAPGSAFADVDEFCKERLDLELA